MRARLFACLLVVLMSSHAHAEFPPKGTMIHEGSKSPDGRYAIVIPEKDTNEKAEDYAHILDSFADLKAQKTLGRLRNAHYWNHANHLSLTTFWAPDSTWCAVVYKERWGFPNVSVVEADGAKFRQTEIDPEAGRILNAALAKKARGASALETDVFVRVNAKRQLRLRVLANSNPKEDEQHKTVLALFQGTYDLAAKKWLATEVQILNEKEAGQLYEAFSAPNEGE